ncbi:TatD family hydrolase [bacterium]|nr:TatD family hydrolase [bacterium]
MMIDTHAHLDFFENPEEIVARAKEKQVEKIMIAGVGPDKFHEIINLIDKFDNVYGSLGVHPEDIDKFSPAVLKEIANLSSHPKIRAIGEIGLDYYWNKENKEKQIILFKAQLELAEALGLPVMVHDREAHADTMSILDAYNLKNVILHCFSGSVEMAMHCILKGYYLGIGGVVTFKNAKVIKEVVKEVPLANIVLETDCPYLTPHPFRGEQNEPSYIPLIAREIANLKDISLDEVASVTTANANKIFNLET